MAWFAYPEDRGTTGSSTEEDWDWNASANLATLAEESHLTDHILDGLDLSWDGSSVTVSSGIAKVTYSGGTSSYADQENRPWPVTFVAGNTTDQTFNQAANTVWDVYITFDLDGGDNVSYVFDDTNTTPTADVVLFIGTIDTSDGTVVDDGPRRPDIEADFTTVYEAIEYENGGSTGTLQWSPTTDRTLELPDSDGTVALLSDTGSDTSVSDDGTEVMGSTTDLNFTAKLNVTDDGDGSVSIDTSALDQEEVEDAINSVISGGTNVTTSYDDQNGVLTINSTDTNLTNEEVQDIVANVLTGGSNTIVTYDDAADTLTIDTTNPSVSDDGTEVLSEPSDLNFAAKLSVTDDGNGNLSIDTSALDQEEVEDVVDGVVSGGTNVTTSYDDQNGILTINSTDTTLTDEEVQDITGNLITGGSNTTVTYDDVNNTLTIDTTNTAVSDDGTEVLSEPSDVNFGPKLSVTDDGDSTVTVNTSALDEEETEDAVETLLTAGSNITLTYDDVAGTLTIDSSDSRSGVSDGGSTVLSDVSDINFGDKLSATDDGDGSVSVSTSALDSEEVQDEVNSLVAGGTNVTVTYDDAGNTLTFDSPTLTNEEVEDIVGSLITSGSNVSVNYDDANDTLTISSTDTHTDVSDGGTTVVSNTGDVNFGDKLSVADDGDETVTVSTSALDTEEVEDAVANLITGGSNVTASYDDQASTLTISSTDTHISVSDSGGTVLTDADGIVFTASNDASVSVTDDGNGTVTVDVDVTDTDTQADVSDDGTLVVGDVDDINFGDKLSATDDGDGSVTVSTDALDTEEVEDAVNSLLSSGSNVTLNYDDTNGTLTISATDTRTDVSDSGGTVVTEAGDIQFTASNDASVTVSDDGDGTATVNVDVTDTRTDVSDDGTLSVSDISDINFGTNLTVTDDGDGSVTVEASGGSGGVDVEDDGSTVVSGSTAINFGSNVSVTDDGDGTVTVEATTGGGGGGDRTLFNRTFDNPVEPIPADGSDPTTYNTHPDISPYLYGDIDYGDSRGNFPKGLYLSAGGEMGQQSGVAKVGAYWKFGNAIDVSNHDVLRVAWDLKIPDDWDFDDGDVTFIAARTALRVASTVDNTNVEGEVSRENLGNYSDTPNSYVDSIDISNLTGQKQIWIANELEGEGTGAFNPGTSDAEIRSSVREIEML